MTTALGAQAAAIPLAVLALVGAGSAQATNAATGSSLSMTAAAAGTSMPTDITITGEEDPALPAAEAVVLDGEYAVATGGTRTTAVLGAVTFDPAGTVVSGALSFIVAAAASETGSLQTAAAATAGDGTGTGDDGLGGDEGDDPVDPAPSGAATATDCSVTSGTYSITSGGGGQAQLELDCGGNSLTANWRLFVTSTQGLAVAQQFRAVQLETLPGAVDAEIVDLTLTLR